MPSPANTGIHPNAAEKTGLPVNFQTNPSLYRHWRVEYAGAIAHLYMDVDENGGLLGGYDLKLNSYDLGVDIELADIIQRMRFEHPAVAVVVLRSAKEKVFCAGANIRMLGRASHAHKVNFCKFTNETRNAMEAAAGESGQQYIAAVRGACAGGGYELALACNEIYMTDDGSTSVALPEVPLLAVLPGTGGLTRVTDKRMVRRDRADVFCCMEEGIRGERAEQWKLVDKVIANKSFDGFVGARAEEIASAADTFQRPGNDSARVVLTPLKKSASEDGSVSYSLVNVTIDRDRRTASITLTGPEDDAPESVAALHAQGDQGWALRLARELDDALLHLRLNELEIGVLLLRTAGENASVVAHEQLLMGNRDTDWLSREILLYWKRVLKRLDVTSRSLIALIENGSCFSGVLAELLFSVDRSYMMEGEFEDDDRPVAHIQLTESNFGCFPMANNLTRLQTRFLDDHAHMEKLRTDADRPLDADAASALGLVTFILDEIDWEDELRVFLEERVSFSADAMTGMEANLRFAGPETMETRIFGRLTAWQNWIFQRPSAVGEDGALQRYGTGRRGDYDRRRV